MPQEFEDLWKRLSPASYGVSMYRVNGRDTRILWDDGKIGHVQSSDDPTLSDYMLAGLGWPKWPMPLQHRLADEKTTYRRLPDDPDRPGMIGIEYTQLPSEPQYPGRLAIFWIDPAKDYLCVYHEDHWRNGFPWLGKPDWKPNEPLTTDRPKDGERYGESDRVREIIEFGRTPDGRWYPKAVQKSGASLIEGKRRIWGPVVTHVQVDFAGSIAGELFELPAEARDFKNK